MDITLEDQGTRPYYKIRSEGAPLPYIIEESLTDSHYHARDMRTANKNMI